MRRHHFPLIALVIGLFLDREIDVDFVRFVILYGDDPAALLRRPIVAGFAVLSAGLVAWQVRTAWTERRA